MDNINLFKKMLKYHSTFIGWLIKEQMIEKNDEFLSLYNKNKNKKNYLKEYRGKVIEIQKYGIKRIYGSSYIDPDFTEIKVREPKVYSLLNKEGIDIFNRNTSSRYCLTSKLEFLLEKFHSDVLDIYFPQDFPRLKAKSATNYIKWLEYRDKYIKENNYNFIGISNYGYLGVEGFSSNQPKAIENIKKYGIFAYKPIYKQIEWTFDLVEKYKDKIIWHLLMNESNLYWEEKMLLKYDNYIPYCTKNNDTYCDKYYGETFQDYSKIGFLSNNFLESHKKVLNWEYLFEEGKFSWNADELKLFCEYALSINLPYSNSHQKPAASQIIFSLPKLLNNKSFSWNKDNLLAFLQLDKSLWNHIKPHKELHNIFLSIPNVKELAKTHIKDNKFWETVCYNKPFDYDELSEEFTIENIEKNINNWSEIIEERFITMRRTPDTNYYYYWVRTKWDDMRSHINIPINYELCKYLKTINITLGGTYCQSDGGTIEEDHRYPEFNGLHLFSGHHFESDEDIKKVIMDDELLDDFFSINSAYNLDLINYMCKTFFKTTSIKEYIEIVNMMKDWDDIREIE